SSPAHHLDVVEFDHALFTAPPAIGIAPGTPTFVTQPNLVPHPAWHCRSLAGLRRRSWCFIVGDGWLLLLLFMLLFLFLLLLTSFRGVGCFGDRVPASDRATAWRSPRPIFSANSAVGS